MYCYTCQPDWESMLSCIYDAYSSRRGAANIRLMIEPITQTNLLDEYIHVDADADKVTKLMDAINYKISPRFYHEMAYSALGYEEDILDNIFHCLIIGFKHGPSALNMVQYRDIMRNQMIRTRIGKEVCRFQEVMRFHQVGDVYVSHFEPKSRIAITLGPIFEDRMPSEYWIIVDDVHHEAVIHPRDEHYYMSHLTDTEFARLLETEDVNDEYTQLFKTFFNSLAIKERSNEQCQLNHFPLWTRKHAVEFK